MVRIPSIICTFLEEYIFLRNSEKFKYHKIYWCEGSLQLVDIVTKNVGNNDLNPRMKYMKVRLEY